MDVSARLRALYGFEETLPSGLQVTLRLPRIRDCIQAGSVPLPVLEHVMEASQKAQGNGRQVPDVSNEEVAHMGRFQDEIVRRSVLAIEGESVSLTLEEIAMFSQADYDRIVEIAMRKSPKVSTS